MAELEGRIALVLGGGAGMGLAACHALAQRGAAVVVADRDGSAAAAAAEALKASGASALPHQVNGSSLCELRGLFDMVAQTYGRLHVMFDNVGVRCAEGLEITEEEFQEALDANLKGRFYAARYAAPLMRPCAPHAAIILMASAGGLRTGGRNSPLYAMTKAGLVMMARELGPEGIRVNALCLGHIETAFSRASGLDETQYRERVRSGSQRIPLRRIGQPEDVGGAVAFLASDESIYMTGLALPIDGGSSA